MPSPIAHIAAGYIAGRKIKLNIWICVLFSILPDFDFLPGILLKDPAEWHGAFSHSLIGLFIFGFVVYWITFLFNHANTALKFSFFSMLIYASHVIMDFFTYGRGIMLLWPLHKRFVSPLSLFIGLRWSDHSASIYHLWTICNEGLFVIAISLFVYSMRNVR